MWKSLGASEFVGAERDEAKAASAYDDGAASGCTGWDGDCKDRDTRRAPQDDGYRVSGLGGLQAEEACRIQGGRFEFHKTGVPG